MPFRMMRWYEDAHGNFVEQFQTTGYMSIGVKSSLVSAPTPQRGP